MKNALMLTPGKKLIAVAVEGEVESHLGCFKSHPRKYNRAFDCSGRQFERTHRGTFRATARVVPALGERVANLVNIFSEVE